MVVKTEYLNKLSRFIPGHNCHPLLAPWVPHHFYNFLESEPQVFILCIPWVSFCRSMPLPGTESVIHNVRRTCKRLHLPRLSLKPGFTGWEPSWGQHRDDSFWPHTGEQRQDYLRGKTGRSLTIGVKRSFPFSCRQAAQPLWAVGEFGWWSSITSAIVDFRMGSEQDVDFWVFSPLFGNFKGQCYESLWPPSRQF